MKYEYEKAEDYFYFEDCFITVGAYSYHIDSCGELELSEEETKKLYLRMKEYYNE